MPLSLIHISYCYDYLLHQISLGLLLYSHIPTALIALLFGGFVLWQTRRLSSVLLALVCAAFAAWCFVDIGSWFAFLGAGPMMFMWGLTDFLSLIFFAFTYYFLYSFVTERDLPVWQKLGGLLILAPSFYWTFTGLNLTGYGAVACEAFEYGIATSYVTYARLAFLGAAILFTIVTYVRSKDWEAKEKVALAGIGVSLFLFAFFLFSYLANLDVVLSIYQYAYNIEIYGLFGMPIFLAYFGYLIVRYHAFNIKMFGAQALVAALVVVLASEFAFVTSTTDRALVGVTLLLTGIVGFVLVRSVRREIEQREHIEKLAKDLEAANSRLKELDRLKSEFLSIASHQLRAPLAAIRGYASLVLQGDYGVLSEPMKDPVSRIAESARVMASSIEDYLNISRIEQGRMKYEIAPVALGDLAHKVVDELQSVAHQCRLELKFIPPSEEITVSADVGKLKQVISNLVDNAIKYTKQGSVSVSIEKKDGKARITVSDTGIGVAKDEMNALFEKFTRARNANKVNTTGTGLGLYVAKQLVEGHKGKIWVESDGLGLGSRFIVELPV